MTLRKGMGLKDFMLELERLTKNCKGGVYVANAGFYRVSKATYVLNGSEQVIITDSSLEEVLHRVKELIQDGTIK